MSDRSKKIYCTKKEDLYSIIISGCRVEISDNFVTIFNNPEVELETELDQLGIIDRRNIELLRLHIGDTRLVDVAFESCEVETSGRRIVFASAWVCFKECSLNGSFTHNERVFEVTGLERGSLCIFKDWKVSTENLDKIRIRNTIIDWKNRGSAEIEVMNSSNEIVRISGECYSLLLNSSDCQLSFFNNFYTEMLSLGGAIEIKKLEVNKQSSLIRQEYTLTIKNILEAGVLEIKEGTISLHVENTDFSKTSINFRNNAALNFEKFHSIASSWNPSRIRYRGFCPLMSQSSDKSDAVNSLPAREFFCEMKTHFAGRGDSITAAEFYAAEMKAHRAYLSTSNSSRQDQLTLAISHGSSNFGQDWVRALLWYIIIGLAISDIFLFFGIIELCFFSNELTKIPNFDAFFFFANVLSPVAIDFSDHIQKWLILPSWLIFLWMLWKIAAGYLIYQIVVSTRRFTRKW